MSGNNNDTSESILETRYRSGVNQATLNIELGLSNGNASGSSSGGSVSVGGGSSGSSSLIIRERTTGEGGGREKDPTLI